MSQSRAKAKGASGEIFPLGGDRDSISVSKIFRRYLAKDLEGEDISHIRQDLKLSSLSYSWKEFLAEKLSRKGL
jgi:hypothetical protein